MKKITIFLSDIIGTINGNIPNEDLDYKKLIELLNQLKVQDGVDVIVFSLISSDNKDVVINMKEKVEEYSNSYIVFGRQFYDCGYEYLHQHIAQEKDVGKINQIMEYIDTLDEYYDIVSIYYADDIEIYQEMLSVISEDRPWSKKLTYITPKENKGLSETNKLIESIIKQKQEEKKLS